MKEISSSAYVSLKNRLESLEEEIKRTSEELEEAIGYGDLRENTEYEVAKATLDKKTREKENIEKILRTAKVKDRYSSTISSGTLVSVQKIGDSGEVLEDLGLLMFDDYGSLTFEGRINSDSNLGAAIVGGGSGEYVTQDIKGKSLRYRVTVEPEERLEEFLEKYPPDRSVMFDRIFGEVEGEG